MSADNHKLLPLPEAVEKALKDAVGHLVKVHRAKIHAIAEDQEKKATSTRTRTGLPNGADLGNVSGKKHNT
jgi:ribosomal protein S5